MYNLVEESSYTGKFKEGEEVVVSGIILPSELKHYGRKGVVDVVSDVEGDDFPYYVKFGDGKTKKWFNEASLTAVYGNYDLEFMAIAVLKEWYGDGFESRLSNVLDHVALRSARMGYPKWDKLSNEASMISHKLEQRCWGVDKP